MSAMTDLVPYEGDGITPEMRAQMDMALEKAREIEGTILNDLQAALNLIRSYQRSLDTLLANDPHLVEARALLHKYKMSTGHYKDQPNRIMVDGHDITEHPDSTPGEVWEEGIDKVELVQDTETGTMKFLPVGTDG